jgi:hypothetical protein
VAPKSAGPFDSSSDGQPPSAVGVVAWAGAGFIDLALKELDDGGAGRRPARSARRFSIMIDRWWSESSSEGVVQA